MPNYATVSSVAYLNRNFGSGSAAMEEKLRVDGERVKFPLGNMYLIIITIIILCRGIDPQDGCSGKDETDV